MHKRTKIRAILKPERFVEERGNKFYAIPEVPSKSAGSGILGELKHYAKSFPRLYRALVLVFSPVFVPPSAWRRLREDLARFDPQDTVVLNLGSGPGQMSDRRDFINVDIFDLENVDLIADAHDLPIRDCSADLVTSMALLEHVQEPSKLVAEINRILKPGGRTICCLPFIAPFHAAPNDFTRWTERGVRELFKHFEEINLTIFGGPTSGLLWIIQDWLALVLSLGNPKLRDMFSIVLMLLTFPFKLLDLGVARLRGAEQLASTFLVTAAKAASPKHGKPFDTVQ